jgi:hypothetical protein
MIFPEATVANTIRATGTARSIAPIAAARACRPAGPRTIPADATRTTATAGSVTAAAAARSGACLRYY